MRFIDGDIEKVADDAYAPSPNDRKEPILFYKVHESGYKQALPGIRLKTLVYGENTLLSEFRLEANSILPRHSHYHEQTGYLVEGRIRLTIGQQTFEAGPGDSWCIPGNTDHSAEILENSLAIEVFSPVREDYLPEKQTDT
jgi:quercetin dioxygenase-like cupin family protein